VVEKNCGIKYDKVIEYLTKDGGALLTFSDFPDEHWNHLRARATSSKARRGDPLQRMSVG
jgi:transposase-like protein